MPPRRSRRPRRASRRAPAPAGVWARGAPVDVVAQLGQLAAVGQHERERPGGRPRPTANAANDMDSDRAPATEINARLDASANRSSRRERSANERTASSVTSSSASGTRSSPGDTGWALTVTNRMTQAECHKRQQDRDDRARAVPAQVRRDRPDGNHDERERPQPCAAHAVGDDGRCRRDDRRERRHTKCAGVLRWSRQVPDVPGPPGRGGRCEHSGGGAVGAHRRVLRPEITTVDSPGDARGERARCRPCQSPSGIEATRDHRASGAAGLGGAERHVDALGERVTHHAHRAFGGVLCGRRRSREGRPRVPGAAARAARTP